LFAWRIHFSEYNFYCCTKNHVHFRLLRSRISSMECQFHRNRSILSNFRRSIFPARSPSFPESIDGEAIIGAVIVTDRRCSKCSLPAQMKNVATSLWERKKKQEKEIRWESESRIAINLHSAIDKRNANRASMKGKMIVFQMLPLKRACRSFFHFFFFRQSVFNEYCISIKHSYK